MAKYKLKKIRTGYGDEVIYTINMVDGNDLIPVRPIRYYETKAGALKRLKKLK